jgi:glucosamine--fructose-6-phosphate aminotransferase (isomerizing)
MSHLEREISAQAAIAQRLLDDPSAIADAARLIGSSSQLLIAARGTSDNAARFAQYLLGARGRLLAGLAAPSLYRDQAAAPRLHGAAALAISQSGQSPDVVGVLAAARAQRRPTIAITNDPASPLAAEADVVVPLRAGEERSVAATGTYTASLLVLVQIAHALVPASGAERRALAALPGTLAALSARELAGRERYDVLARAAWLTVTGRGLHYATAHETALKVRELSGLPAEGLSPADLMHGPIAALDERTALWHVDPDPSDASLRAADRRAGVIVVVGGAAGAYQHADVVVPLPSLPRWAGPLTAIVPAQVAALRLAELGGVEPDAPHGLRKVTRTR